MPLAALLLVGGKGEDTEGLKSIWTLKGYFGISHIKMFCDSPILHKQQKSQCLLPKKESQEMLSICR